MSDEQLFVLVGRGDRAAFGEFYHRHGGSALTVAAGVMRDRAAAEDVVHEVFLSLWERRKRLPSPSVVHAWLMRRVRCRAIDALRSDGAHSRALVRAADSAPRMELEQRRVGTGIRNALGKLSQAERETLLLAYEQGMTHTEIAMHQGIPLGTAKSRIRLGLAKLRRLVGKAMGGIR